MKLKTDIRVHLVMEDGNLLATVARYMEIE